MTYTCPKDPAHRSEDADYCSVCGAKIQGPAPVTAPLSAGAFPATACPDCGSPRAPGARFCEVCRHDFETGTVGPAPAPAPPPFPPPSPTPPELGAGGRSSPPAGTWEAVIAVDPSLYTEPDPNVPCPMGEPERTFPLDRAENLVGRRSDSKDIHPEIPLTDPGVSHRHAKIMRAPDGGLVVLDVGSTNGTQVNGADLAAGVRVPVGDGDQITLGCWTRITLRRTP